MNWFFINTLLKIPRFGRKTVAKLIAGSPITNTNELTSAILFDFLADAFDKKLFAEMPEKNDVVQALDNANKIWELMDRHQIHACSINENTFPRQIAETINSPILLFYKGNFNILNKPGVAVIGTRQPTSHGADVAERFGEVFSQKGFTVVSGLAIGCDTGGHQGCLKTGGETCAVLGHGLETVYPAANKKLAQQIVENGGCLVSEYAPGTRSMPAYFVERDRIQSAASMGVVVVETDVRGGTMHAVKFAKQYGRLVGCYLHDPTFSNQPQTQGNKMLINEKTAEPLRSSDDIEQFSNKMFDLWKNFSTREIAPIEPKKDPTSNTIQITLEF